MTRSLHPHGLIGQYAGFISRAVGLIVDLAIIALLLLAMNLLLALPLSMLLGLDPSVCLSGQLSAVPADHRLTCMVANITWLVITVTAAPVYFIFFYMSTGQTIGMYVMGLRVVRLDGKPMSLWSSIVRWVGLFLSAIPVGLGFLWVLIDDRRQGWMDKMAGTCVIYAWSAEQDEFFLDKFRRFVQRGRQAWNSVTGKPQLAVADPGKHYDLVAIAFPDYDKLDNVLGAIQNGISDGEFQVLNATVLAKGDGDSVSVMGASDLATGSRSLVMPARAIEMPEYEMREVLCDVPEQHFVVAVILEEQWADLLIRRVSRVTSTLVRRYDLDQSLPETAAATRQTVTATPSSAVPVAAVSNPAAVRTAPVSRSTAAPVAVPVTAVTPVSTPAPYANAAFGTTEVSTITAQAEALQQKFQQTLVEAEGLRTALAGRDVELGRLRAELDALRATSVSADELKKVQGQAEALEQVLARTMAERTAALATLDSRNQELAAAQQALDALRATTVSAGEVQKRERQLETLEQKLQRSLADGAAAQAASDKRAAELVQLRSQVELLQRQLQQAQSGQQGAQAALDKRESELARIREQLAALQSTSVGADDFARLKGQAERLQKQVQQVDRERNTVLAALGDRDAEMAELRADLAERNREVAELRTIQDGLAAAVEGWTAVAAGQVPAVKRRAVQAALAQGIPGRATETLQDLADLVDIGTVYEQRLYRTGIGTFWEVAHLADGDFTVALGLSPQQATVDFEAVRADALHRATATGTLGLFYTGETPDDFEPIAGIGKVFEQRLYAAGLRTYAALAAATPDQLAAICQARKPLEPDYAGWIRQAQALLSRA